MTLAISRINLRLLPDHKKVIPRFFNTGTERSLMMIDRVLKLDKAIASVLLTDVMNEFASRYINIRSIFLKHFEQIKYLLTPEQHSLEEEQKLLIGAYFTMEYSIEAAALFNPSIVEDPYQDGAAEGETRVIMSFRATGESHISSLIFRRAKLDKDGMIHFEPPGKFNGEGTITLQKQNSKAEFKDLLQQMKLPADIIAATTEGLPDQFSYKEIERILKTALLKVRSTSQKKKMAA